MKHRPIALTASLIFPLSALAQTVTDLGTMQITESRMTTSIAAPAAVLEGDRLIETREPTLGATLEKLPGVRGSSFGAGASRPVIRGLDGARVKVLANGAEVLDASTISPDHAVTSEPMLAERIEVLKGPATLLYGGGAVGGVVNVVDKKVPTYIPERGYEGEMEWRGNTAANESTGMFGLTAGAGQFAIRVEGVKRNADEYEIPGAEGEPRSNKQTGSYNDTQTGTIGSSWVTDRGYLGLAYTRQKNRYGLLAHSHADCHTHGPGDWHCGSHGHSHGHDDHDHDHDHAHGIPYIDMTQERWDLRGEYSDPLPGIEKASLRAGHSEYEHKEVEGGVAATRFDSKATDGRIELTHQPLWGWQGIVGLQTLRRDFKASGQEAYIPPTLTHNHALFLLERYSHGDWQYELGLRHEWQSIDAEHGHEDTSHRGTSISAGAVWQFADDYSLGFSLSRSQRLPAAEELYADGPHAATRTIEIGNSDLDEETSHNVEITLRKLVGRMTFDLSLYHNRINDFIYAADTGRNIGGNYREIHYTQHDATLTGLEGEASFQVTDAFAVTLFGDHVRGKLRHGGGDLPRIPADRLGFRLNQSFTSALQGELEFYRVQRQSRTADFERDTGGYNMLGAGLSYYGTLASTDYLLYLRADNLFDVKAREHTSFIKDEVLLAGRNLTVGVRVSF